MSAVDRVSGWVWIEATQVAEVAHVEGEGCYTNLCLGPHQANRAH